MRCYPCRFSVRTLLVALTIFACAFGFIGSILHSAHLQRVAADELADAGYKLSYDYQLCGIDIEPVAEYESEETKAAQLQRINLLRKQLTNSPPPQRWPLSLLPADAIQQLAYLDLSFSDASDQGVSHLKEIPSVARLNVIGSSVSAEMAKLLQKKWPNSKVEYY